MPRNPGQNRQDDNTRQIRLARLHVVMKEADTLRINVGPRHPAHEHLRAAYHALIRAKEQLTGQGKGTRPSASGLSRKEYRKTF